MQDCAAQQRALLQWMSQSPTAGVIDRELGDLRGDLVPGGPLLSYLRYNVDLRAEEVKKLDSSLGDELIESLSAMDAPENMAVLYRLGQTAAGRDIAAAHFPAAFDLA